MPSPHRTKEIAVDAAGGHAGINEETLAGTKTLTLNDVKHQKLDPGGGHRDVNLPAEEVSRNREFWIWNAANGAENLVVKDDGGSTIGTVSQNDSACFVCTGSAWKLTFMISGGIS